VACLVGGFPLLHNRSQPHAASSTEARAEAESTPQLVLEAGGHQALIRTLLFTANGQELVSVSDDKTIRVWSVSLDGRRATLARTLRGQMEDGRPGMLATAAISPPDATGQQRWLAVGGSLAGSPAERAAVRLHDYTSGAVQALLLGHTDDVLAIAFAPRGRWLASAGKDGTIRLWDLTALQGAQLTRPPLVLTGHTDHIYALAWSASGDRLAAGSNDHTVSLWDTTQLDQSPVARPASLRGHTDQVYSVAFHPDGSVLASGGADQTIRLWRARDGQAQGVLAQAAHKVSALAFAPNGQWLLTGNYAPPRPRQLTVFAYPAGQVQRTFTGHDNLVIATAVHPSGQWVASGDGDDKAILLWDVHTGQVLSRLASQGQTITAVGFAPDGQMISWGSTARYTSDNDRGPLDQQFDLRHLVRLPRGVTPSAALRAQTQVGQVELSTEQGGPNNDAYRLHVRRGRTRVSTIERGSTTGYRHSAYTLTPDGQHVLSGGLNGVLTLYRLDGTPRATLVGHTGEVLAVAIAGDGRWALSGAVDHTLALWSLADLPAASQTTLRPTLRLFPASDGAWVAWTPEGFFAASNNGEGARLIGYSLNQGVAALAQYVSVEQLYERFYRPDLLVAKLHGDPAKLLQQQGALIDVDIVLPQSLPPQVAIVQPTSDFTTAQREVEVQIMLTDQGGGTGKVVWNIDGVTLGVTRASSPRAVRGQTISHAQRLPLAPGTNTITVVAYDQRDLVASAPATLTVHLATPSPAPPPATPSVPPPAPSPSHALPPLVTFVTPASDTTVTQPTIDVQVTLTDQGGGIGKVLWTLNTAPIDAETRGGSSVAKRGGKRGMHTMAPIPSEPGKQMLTKSFVLTPGTNTITVVTYTRDNDVASPPAVRTVQLTTAPTAVASSATPVTTPPAQNTPLLSTQPALSMLVVGINQYRDKALWLRYAVPDGQDLAASVRHAAAPLVREVKVTTLFDEQATTAELEAAFARVASQTSSNDIFVLYLAGHGVTLDGHYHFIPQDFRYTNQDAVRQQAITQDHLQRWLASVPARKSVILIDTCESGSFSQSLAVMRGMVEKTAIDRLSRATGRATIVAATDTQPAMEGYEGHGVFTYVVMQALQYADSISGNRDGITGLFELAAYVNVHVPEITMRTFAYEQIPQVHMQGTDFPVGVVLGATP
jgi:WD40 repeat protein